jgi:hypothetical protein
MKSCIIVFKRRLSDEDLYHRSCVLCTENVWTSNTSSLCLPLQIYTNPTSFFYIGNTLYILALPAYSDDGLDISETSVQFYHTTRSHIPENVIFIDTATRKSSFTRQTEKSSAFRFYIAQYSINYNISGAKVSCDT